MKARVANLLISVFLFVSILVGQDRGMKPVQVPVDGKATTLYKNSHALIIGVADYYSGWTQLPGVRDEVAMVKASLQRNGFSVEIVMNPTHDQLYKAFTDFISKYGNELDNRLLFFFAGHGYTFKTAYGEELGYLVPVNAPNPNYDPSGFQNQAMEMAQVEIYARRLQAKHALFIFDACFSGTLFSNTRAIPEIITYKTTLPVRQFITSGSADEMVPDKSIFAEQFVRALDGDADYDRNDYITGSELGEYLQSTVVNYTHSMQHPQYGKIRSPNLDKGDFVFPVSKETTYVPPIAEPYVAVTTFTPPPTAVTPPPATAIRPTVTATPPTTDSKQPSGAPSTKPYRKTDVKKEEKKFTPMVLVEGGNYLMGAKRGARNERPQHFVQLDSFYISKYEVTKKEWKEIMGSNPSAFQGCESCPIDKVSWNDVQAFLTKLNKKTGKNYRLPTEAEWEYAARGGKKSLNQRYAGNNNASVVAWIKANAAARTHPVGTKWPNELGIYDMSGNVLEWCSDWYESDYYTIKGTHVNPKGPMRGGKRSARGGSFKYDSGLVTVTFRFDLGEDAKYSDVGFRLVLTEE